MYLSALNTCTIRVNIQINGCLTFTRNQDNCGVCAEGSKLTTDKLKCLQLIENCASY